MSKGCWFDMANPQVDISVNSIIVDPAIAARAAMKLAIRTMPITKDEALRIGKDYATIVRNRVDPDALVYVFGSAVMGKTNINSDIDIAVVSKTNDISIYDAFANLSVLADEVSWDIEVHTVAISDWIKGNPHVLEIQRQGISV
jgi:predicted nucleotidyltransferase